MNRVPCPTTQRGRSSFTSTPTWVRDSIVPVGLRGGCTPTHRAKPRKIGPKCLTGPRSLNNFVWRPPPPPAPPLPLREAPFEGFSKRCTDLTQYLAQKKVSAGHWENADNNPYPVNAHLDSAMVGPPHLSSPDHCSVHSMLLDLCASTMACTLSRPTPPCLTR